MKAWMMALVTASRARKTQTFTGNASFTVPSSTAQLDMAGHGSNGTPETTEPGYNYSRRTVESARRRSDGVWIVYQESTSTGWAPAVPSDSCDAIISSGDVEYSAYQFCYYYTSLGAATQTFPAQPGEAVTGFGQSLPGGAPGAAAPTTILPNVTVTPGVTYSIVVPAGGSLTITYYQ